MVTLKLVRHSIQFLQSGHQFNDCAYLVRRRTTTSGHARGKVGQVIAAADCNVILALSWTQTANVAIPVQRESGQTIKYVFVAKKGPSKPTVCFQLNPTRISACQRNSSKHSASQCISHVTDEVCRI